MQRKEGRRPVEEMRQKTGREKKRSGEHAVMSLGGSAVR
jgi:hypothetical protein